jgi:pyruvate kinase
VKPLLVDHLADTIDGMFQQIDHCLMECNLADRGDKVLIMGGIPMHKAGSTNFLKIHTIGEG